MEIIKGGVTAALGFSAAGTAAGMKKSKRKDMALVYSQTPCKVAGVFTKNVVKAAPVVWDQEIVKNAEYAQAVVINAGIANACTGKRGYAYCEEIAELASELLQIPQDAVLLASTGVIGPQLPMENIRAGLKALMLREDNTAKAGLMAAEAIMTTDTKSKEAAAEFQIGDKTVTIGGMCKGTGMIHPNMCTMIAVLTTDVRISKELLQEALRTDIEDTYNMVSVDGDTSTNDTVLLLANAQAGNEEINQKDEHYTAFVQALHAVNASLAKQMAKDGEGATRMFETKVLHAQSKQEARCLAKSVVCSSLVKAAIFGKDANWGRILCAMGYCGVDFDPNKVEIRFQSEYGDVLIYKDGEAADFNEREATNVLSAREVTILADMNSGEETASAWGCDLTYDYVKINADYRS